MIIIKNMDMPTRCADCKLCVKLKSNDYGSYGQCIPQEYRTVDCLMWSRDDNCPMEEIKKE